MAKPAKNTICLWYKDDAENAARFYAQTFPDSSVDAVHRAPTSRQSTRRVAVEAPSSMRPRGTSSN